MKTFVTTVALLIAGLFVSTGTAHAGVFSIGVGIHIGHRDRGHHRPLPHRPHCPPPVVVAPCPPVVVVPPPVVVAPRPVYRPCPPPVVVIERPVVCHAPFVTTVYEERWVTTTTVVGYDRVWDARACRWVTVERTVTTSGWRTVPVEVTAHWYPEHGCYGYVDRSGSFRRVRR